MANCVAVSVGCSERSYLLLFFFIIFYFFKYPMVYSSQGLIAIKTVLVWLLAILLLLLQSKDQHGVSKSSKTCAQGK